MDVDTFLTELYVQVDDYCKTLPPMAPQPGQDSHLTRSETVTLLIFSQWGIFQSERDFYRYANRHLRKAFPDMPTRPQFNRQARRFSTEVSAFSHFYLGISKN